MPWIELPATGALHVAHGEALFRRSRLKKWRLQARRSSRWASWTGVLETCQTPLPWIARATTSTALA
eukprot:7385033-Prymnesium_polylepis.1